MIASDGPVKPDDVSDNRTLWSFPEGRLIKSVSALPTAVSANWKFYATYQVADPSLRESGQGERNSRPPPLRIPL